MRDAPTPTPDMAPLAPPERAAPDDADSVGAAPTRTVAAPEELPRVLARGATVGRCVVLEHVAEGGMGTLYKAFDPQLDRSVALKLVRQRTPSDAEAGERLLREARALARLSHPNIVPVFEAGLFEGEVYLAMEFVEGATLRAWLGRAPRSREVVLGAFLAAGEGLAAAHGAGLVHRDFKPDNVIVGADGRVRVVDFGLARSADAPLAPAATTAGKGPPGTAVSADGGTEPKGAFPAPGPRPSLPGPSPSDGRAEVSARSASFDGGSLRTSGARVDPLATPLTSVGAVLGTPRYMAPEQYMGLPLDGRTDQFAFGVSLYEALFGRHPFHAKTRDALRARVCLGSMDPPPSGTPRWLRVALARALASSPDDRFPAMDGLLAALRTDPRRAWQRRAAWSAGALAVVGVASAAFAVRGAQLRVCDLRGDELRGVWDDGVRAALQRAFAATGLAIAADTADRAARALDDYAQAFRVAKVDACAATKLRHEQSDELLDLRMACLAGRKEQLRAQTALFAKADRDVVLHASASVEGLPPLSACADARALRTPVKPKAGPGVAAALEPTRSLVAEAQALSGAGKHREARERATAAEEAARSLGYAPILAEALFQKANAQSMLGDYEAASATLKETMVTAEAGHHDALAATARMDFVSVTGDKQGRFREAHEWLPFAEAAVVRAGDTDDLRARLAMNHAMVLFREGKYVDAEAAARRALAAGERFYPPDHMELARVTGLLGTVLSERGDLRGGNAYLERSIGIVARRLGEAHPDLWSPLANVGINWAELGEYERALSFYRRASDLLVGAAGDKTPDYGILLGNIARSLAGLERLDEAIATEEEAEALFEGAGMGEHQQIAYVLGDHGDFLLRAGKPDEAARAFERAVAVWKKSPAGLAHPGAGTALAGAAAMAQRAGRLADARALYEQALVALGDQPSEIVARARARLELASCLGDGAKDRERARALVAEARLLAQSAGPKGDAVLERARAWEAKGAR